MLRNLLLASALTAGLAAPASAALNLVQNGSFESGLTGWTIGGTETQGFPPAAIFYGAASPYPTGAFGEAVPAASAMTLSPDAAGARAAYFVSDFANQQSLTQTLFLTPGLYTIGFSAYAPRNGFNNAGDAMFQATIANVLLANYAVSTGPATTWVHATGAANIASAGNYLIEFLFSTNLRPSKDIVIDQVYVIAGNPGGGDPTEVPGPAALGLFGLGLLGLAALRRRG
jgi:hypothetical protein